MTTQAFDAPDGLRRLIAQGALTEEGLHSITGIGQDAIRSFVPYGRSDTGLTKTPQVFSLEESTRLSVLAAQLVDGMTTADDERLTGVLESLTIEFHLTSQNIARLTGLDAGDVAAALSDPRSISVERKYEIAVRTSYLLGAFNRARTT